MTNENHYGANQGLAGVDAQHGQDQPRDTKAGRSGAFEGPSGPDVAASVREAAGDAADLVKRKAQDVGHMAEAKAEALVSWIKERPIASALIAAGVGYLMGKLARR